MSHSRTRRGQRGRARVRTRLLVAVMAPLLLFTALAVFDAAERRDEARLAADIDAQAARAQHALALDSHLIAERSASELVVMAGEYGFDPGQASDLLGIDLAGTLADARTSVDLLLAAGGPPDLSDEVPALEATRAAVDAARSSGVDLERFYGRLIDVVETTWLSEVDTVGLMTYEMPGSAGIRRDTSALRDVSGAFTHGSNETAIAARLLVPGLSSTTTGRLELAASNALYERATAAHRDRLGPRARDVFEDRVLDDPDVQAFESFVDDLLAAPDSTAPPTLDVPRLAEVFRSGLIRQDNLLAVVDAAMVDVVATTAQVRDDAQASLRRYLAAVAVAFVVVLAVAATTVRSITGPLRRLAKRASEVSAGEIDGDPLALGGPRDIALVAEAFNETVANLSALDATAHALADARFDDPVLEQPVPGRIGASLRRSVDSLSKSMRDNESLRRTLATNEARFRALVQHADDVIIILDRDGRVTYHSPSVEAVLGYPPEVIAGTRLHDHVRSDAAAALDRLLAEGPGALAGSRPFTAEVRDHYGFWRSMEGSATDMFDLPEVEGLVINARDVTARVRAEESVRESEARFRLMFESNPLPMWVYDVDTLAFLEVNEAAVQAYGYEREELLAMRVSDLHPPEDGDVFAGGEGARAAALDDGVWRHVARDGRMMEVHLTTQAVDIGGHQRILVMAEDASERLAAERRLTYQATHDALTGLPNRLLLLDRLELAIARSSRSEGDLAVVFIDLDHFKVVNDAKGHTAGDKLLIEVSERIRTILRPGDTVARFGGDEFVVILEGVDGAPGAAVVCDRIREALEQPFQLGGSELVVTASQGIAIAGADEDAEDLLRAADAAMYSAKEGGRARSEVADHAVRSSAARRLKVEADLRRGIDAGEFVSYYQPVVNLVDGSIIGAEALVRWADPDAAIVGPEHFISIAEETGLIVPLGAHVLEEALQEAASWPVAADGTRPFVSVNVSGRQLLVSGLADVVERALARAQIDPGRLHLEVTESVLMRDIERSASALEAIAALGVHISIDDFGTGYSSLRYLQHLPIDTLKVDRSFVELLDQAGRDTSIVAAVLNLARALALDVVAEGVETEGQIRELRHLGCERAQGFYFSRAVPAAEFAALLADGRRLGDLPPVPAPT